MTDVTEAMSYLVNPDAWINIPEFGVMPSEVNYEGFSFPVVHATVDPFSVNLMELIGVARKLAQREFKTLEELKEVYVRVLDVMIEEEEEGCTEWTARQSVSVMYMEFMERIKEARFPALQYQSKLLPLESLSNAALLLAWWGTHGAKAAAKLLSKRNSGNASMPRETAKSPFREAVISAMRPHKRGDQKFKSFMSMWEQDSIDGLTIKTHDHKDYVITDENGDMGEQSYTWGSLESMYSQAK